MSKLPFIHQGNQSGRMGIANPRFFVGIDPDVEKSGLAIVDKQARCVTYAGALMFPEVITHLHMIAQEHAQEPLSVLVVIEDSDTSTNWHTNKLMTNGQPLKNKLSTAAAIGRSAGMCHATLRHLKECAEHMGLPVLMQPPFRKYWKGPDGKITHEECAEFAVGLPKRTNQEVRDAVLLAWLSANIPIRIQPIK